MTDRKRFPTFAHGYESIYVQDLPVYVSADSILDAIHRSYDSMLEALERSALSHDVGAMLVTMRAQLAAGGQDPALSRAAGAGDSGHEYHRSSRDNVA